MHPAISRRISPYNEHEKLITSLEWRSLISIASKLITFWMKISYYRVKLFIEHISKTRGCLWQNREKCSEITKSHKKSKKLLAVTIQNRQPIQNISIAIYSILVASYVIPYQLLFVACSEPSAKQLIFLYDFFFAILLYFYPFWQHNFLKYFFYVLNRKF